MNRMKEKKTQEITFRAFRNNDIEQCAKIIAKSWFIASSFVIGNASQRFMKSYVDINKVVSTWLEVALDSENIIGFIFCRLDKEYNFSLKVKAFLSFLKILSNFLVGKYGKVKNPIKYIKKFLTTEKKVGTYTPKSDAQVCLFAIDSRYRGLGIGNMLLTRFITKARLKRGKCITVYTDALSNWKFYEKFGFKRYKTFYDDFDSYIKNEDTEGFIYVLNI
jgi:ribosomal protein S18 acetylase RimI-like enzyme